MKAVDKNENTAISMRRMRARTFFMSMDRPDVALEMFSSVETFATPINFADVHPFFGLRGSGSFDIVSRRDTSATTLFGEVGNRDREDCTATRYASVQLCISSC